MMSDEIRIWMSDEIRIWMSDEIRIWMSDEIRIWMSDEIRIWMSDDIRCHIITHSYWHHVTHIHEQLRCGIAIIRHAACHNEYECVTSHLKLNYMCGVTPSCVWHDPFVHVTRLIHVCDMTHLYVWHDPFVCVSWPIYMCDMTHSYVWHEIMCGMQNIVFLIGLFCKRDLWFSHLFVTLQCVWGGYG